MPFFFYMTGSTAHVESFVTIDVSMIVVIVGTLGGCSPEIPLGWLPHLCHTCEGEIVKVGHFLSFLQCLKRASYIQENLARKI